MQQIQLADQLYQEAQRRAAEAGFSTVDEYVAVVVTQDISDPVENLDRYFTPQRLAHIDKSLAEINNGRGYSRAEADEELAKLRVEWLRNKSG